MAAIACRARCSADRADAGDATPSACRPDPAGPSRSSGTASGRSPIVADGAARLFSRRGEQIDRRATRSWPPLGAALGGRRAILDGEIVAIDDDGRPSFQLLQRRMGVTAPLTIQRRVPETPVTFVAFDLLALDGETSSPSLTRSAASCCSASGSTPSAGRRRAHHLGDGDGPARGRPRGRGSRASSPSGSAAPTGPGPRSRDWVKVRLKLRQDFVIGGWHARRRRPREPARLAAARRLGRRPGGGGRARRAPAAAVLRRRRRQRPLGADDRPARRAARAAAREETSPFEPSGSAAQAPEPRLLSSRGSSARSSSASGRARTRCASPPSRACATTSTRETVVREG